MKPMGRIALVLLLMACNEPKPANEVTVAPLPSSSAPPAATSATTSTSNAAPSETAPAPTTPIETRCAPGQLNVPCVFQSNGKCFVRQSNCTERPCTESAPREIACDVYAKAREATACDVVRVCRGISDEGCVVETGCTPRMPTCIEKSCAPKILAATGCSHVPVSCIK